MKRNQVMLSAAILLLGTAGWMIFSFLRSQAGPSEKAYFYDLSEKKLFVASRELIPPIRGVNDATEDGVRAVVVSVTGDPKDASARRIAYLEKYSPELKTEMESARASGGSPAMGRGAAQQHRFVRRVEDAEWSSLATPGGEQIVNEWVTWGTNGASPAVCAP